MPYSTREKIHNYVNNPTHKTEEKLENSVLVKVDNCDDQANILINFENKIVKLVKYSGDGCSIFVSTIECISDLITNMNIVEASSLLDNYIKYIEGQEVEIDEELKIFEIIKSHVSRKKCTLGPAKTFKEIIDNKKE